MWVWPRLLCARTDSHIRVIFEIAFQPEKHLVSVSAIVQCAGHSARKLLHQISRAIFAKLFVFNEFEEPSLTRETGIRAALSSAEARKKNYLRKNTCENF